MIARPLRKSLSNKIILVEMLFLAEGGGDRHASLYSLSLIVGVRLCVS